MRKYICICTYINTVIMVWAGYSFETLDTSSGQRLRQHTWHPAQTDATPGRPNPRGYKAPKAMVGIVLGT